MHKLSFVHVFVSKRVHKGEMCVMGTQVYCFLVIEAYQSNEIKTMIKRSCAQQRKRS